MGGKHPSREVGLKAQVSGLSRRLADSRSALEAAVARRRGNEPPAPSDGRLEELGAIAHDLNNVFAAILMAVSLLRQNVAGERAMRMLAVLEENAARGAELVRRVRAFGTEGGGGRVPARPSRAAGGPRGQPAKRKSRRGRASRGPRAK
ncbi:MAG TPA: hypothetical protein VN775_12825 [Opitutaceae bacterium]|nr:hypothetical protein [Opitutaceae bacterium]